MKRTLLAAAFALLASPALPGRAADPPPAAGPIVTKAPHDWIVYDDNSLTPVVDEVSRHLADARMAFDAKDPDARPPSCTWWPRRSRNNRARGRA